MFISISTKNKKNMSVFNYTGNEDLLKSLGADTVVTLNNGKTLYNQVLVLVDISASDMIHIYDGVNTYSHTLL